MTLVSLTASTAIAVEVDFFTSLDACAMALVNSVRPSGERKELAAVTYGKE